MNKTCYKIISENKIKQVSINDLVFSIQPDCQIFEVSLESENKEETNLGVVSLRVLHYIAFKVIELFIQKHLNRKGKQSPLEKFIYLIGEYFKNPDSVSSDDLQGVKYRLEDDLNRVSPIERSLRFSCISLIFAIIDNTIDDVFQAINYAASAKHDGVSHYFELILFFGEYIVDFLKSVKHLFMV